MKRSVWKWTFGLSLALLVLLILFAIGIWALGNATAAMLGGIMGFMDSDNFGYQYLPLGDFLKNTICSPLFYIYMADLALLMISAVALILNRKHK